VLYQARRGSKRVVVLDDQPGPEYDTVLFTLLRPSGWPTQQSTWPPRILPDGAIQYAALTGGNPAELYIVTQWPFAESATPPR